LSKRKLEISTMLGIRNLHYIKKEYPKESLDAPVKPAGYYEVTINYIPVEEGRN